MRSYRNQPGGTVPRARALRRNATEAERRMWRALRQAFPEQKRRRQVPIGPYFADFLNFAARLVVEVDGGQHSEAAGYDARRTHCIETEGYRVIRFWNNDIMENLEGVLARISLLLGERGEGDRTSLKALPSPSHASRGPLPLPMGEGL